MRRLTAKIIALCLLTVSAAQAHAPASSYLTVNISDATVATLVVDVAVADVIQILPLDADRDGRLSWGEVLTAQNQLYAEIASSSRLTSGGAACTLVPRTDDLALTNYNDLLHLSAIFSLQCAGQGQALAGSFDLFSDINPKHRVITRIRDDSGNILHLHAMNAADGSFALTIADEASAYTMLREGVVHILAGYDHLLFLLLLILPAIGLRNLPQRLWRLAGIVTSFTVAHSITLGLAATGVISLPSRWVEVAIAASIIAAGLVNVWRPMHRIGWQLAFAFGLLHGFGFAGALAELGLSGNQLLLQLFAFNLGVELGQLAVVLVSLPVLLLLASLPRYHRLMVPLLSASGAGMGLVWVASRL